MMKRIFMTLVLSLMIIGVNAQEHLSFKGIPIDGTMASFCQKLKAKGFTQAYSDGNVRMFEGDFTGVKATVGVISTNDGQNVFRVVVLLPASGEWKTLVNTYQYYKDLYTKKYGEPSGSREENPSYSDSNIALMQELYNGTVVFGSFWEVPGGSIVVEIKKSTGFYEGEVAITYKDSQNTEKKSKQNLDDI